MSWISVAAAVAGAALAFVIVLGYVCRWRWAGLRPKQVPGKEPQPAKTLWDWLQLLVIPLALAGLAFLLNTSQSNREQQREDQRIESDQRREDQRATRQRDIAADTAREEALRAYLAQMSDLILDRKLLSPRLGSNVQAVARTLTLTALRRLDGERKGLVVEFLREARLVEAGAPKVDLSNADLHSADLAGAVLDKAVLAQVNLRRANLRETLLENAVLGSADLRRANLRWAQLPRAFLELADLRRADLAAANLWYADLTGADLTGADLAGADLGFANLRGADLAGADLAGADLDYARSDSQTQWPRGFDPKAAGVVREPD